jgi:DNA invertase Pin-like site-specific DNA recombinase
MKAISYLRFSTPEQALGNSTERQIQAARDYCSRNELELDESLSIADEGLSAYKGHNVDRGSLGHFLAEVEDGKIPSGTALIVEKLDRFSREGPDETTDILKALTRNGVEVHVIASGAGNAMVLKHGFNKNLNDYIMIGLQAHLAYQESRNKSDRCKSAWEAKKQAAIHSHTPLGKRIPTWLAIEGQVRGANNKIIDQGKIVEVPERAAVVQEVFRLASQGIGTTKITQLLNGRALSRSWVVKTLSNRAVLGEFQTEGYEVVKNYFPQIISQSEFDAARAQMKGKRRNGKFIGGNRQKSHLAPNLFSGLMFDITSAPERKMHFQDLERGTYLMSAIDKGGRRSNRMRYDKLEKALLGFLDNVEWAAVAGESESDEYKATKAALEAKRRLADAVSREITANTEAMIGEDVDTRRQFMRENAKHEAVLATLTQEIDSLQASVEEAQAKSADLAETKTFRELLNQLNSNPALRLPAKALIQKKVSRIDLIFMPDRLAVAAFLQYTNGAPDSTVIFNRDVDEDTLRALGAPSSVLRLNRLPFRILRQRDKPRESNALKADVLKWVKSHAELESVA